MPNDANEGLMPTVPGEIASTPVDSSATETDAPEKGDTSKPATDGAKTIEKEDETQEGTVPTIKEDADDDEGAEGDTEKDGEGEEDTEPAGDAEGEQEEKRLDQHPRFKEVIAQKNEAKERAEKAEREFANLKREIDTLKQSVQRPVQRRQDTGPTYSNLMDMEDGELVDMMNESPKAFLQNLAQQIHHEISGEINKNFSEKERKQQTKQILSDYAKGNDDFVPLYEKGELQKFINANRHMGLNLISAHKLLTGEKKEAEAKASLEKKIKDLESKLEKEVKNAEEKGRQKAEENFRAKKSLKSTKASPARRSGNDDNELKDTKTTGGRDRTLYQRLLSKRKGSG